MVDGLELERAADALRIALFHVEGGGEPEVVLDVGPPAIEVIVLVVVLVGAFDEAVEADDVAVVGFDPDAAEELALSLVAAGHEALSGDGGDVEDGGRRGAEEVVADEAEVIVLAVEADRVHEHHADEAVFLKLEVETCAEAGDRLDRVLEEAAHLALRLALHGILPELVVADDLAEVDAGEVVLIGQRYLEEDRIRPHVLDVGLDDRSALLDDLDDLLFPDDGLVDEGVLSSGQLPCRRLVLVILLLAPQGAGMGGKRGGNEEGQKHSSGEMFREVHDSRLLKASTWDKQTRFGRPDQVRATGVNPVEQSKQQRQAKEEEEGCRVNAATV